MLCLQALCLLVLQLRRLKRFGDIGAIRVAVGLSQIIIGGGT